MICWDTWKFSIHMLRMVLSFYEVYSLTFPATWSCQAEGYTSTWSIGNLQSVMSINVWINFSDFLFPLSCPEWLWSCTSALDFLYLCTHVIRLSAIFQDLTFFSFYYTNTTLKTVAQGWAKSFATFWLYEIDFCSWVYFLPTSWRCGPTLDKRCRARLIISKCYSLDFLQWLRIQPRNPRFYAYLTLPDHWDSWNPGEISWANWLLCFHFLGISMLLVASVELWPSSNTWSIGLQQNFYSSDRLSNHTEDEAMYNRSAHHLPRCYYTLLYRGKAEIHREIKS